jgi:hypothetical protein
MNEGLPLLHISDNAHTSCYTQVTVNHEVGIPFPFIRKSPIKRECGSVDAARSGMIFQRRNALSSKLVLVRSVILCPTAAEESLNISFVVPHHSPQSRQTGYALARAATLPCRSVPSFAQKFRGRTNPVDIAILPSPGTDQEEQQ